MNTEKITLMSAINADSFIQFDTNEQLRNFIELHGLQVNGYVYDSELFISTFSEFDFVMTVPEVTYDAPVYHHTQII